jgi:dTDP-4-amino-4,6-dideoxygalactose transaminase
MIPLVDLRRQYQTIKAEIDRAVLETIERSVFVMGDEVVAFEREFAAFQGVRHCIGVASGTSALHLALVVLGIGPGDEVITVANSFVATAEAIAQAGARAVFVDVDEGSFTMHPAQVQAAITPRTKALMPVHLYGQMADMDPIMDLARAHRLAVIEDAAQAHGAEYRGQRAGRFGALACFSFYPSKNLGAFGDAGALLTNDEALARKARLLLNHGRIEKYNSIVSGYNYRMDTLQAAILRVKLCHLPRWNDLRRQRACLYDKLLAGTPVATPREMGYGTHVYHLYVIQTDRRDALAAYLKQRDIATGVHYPIPIHRQAAFAGNEHRQGSFSVTDRLAPRILSLPLFPELASEEVETVVQAILDFHRS